MTRKSTGNRFSKHVARRHDAPGLRTGLKSTVKRGYSELTAHAKMPRIGLMKDVIELQRQPLKHNSQSRTSNKGIASIQSPTVFLADSGLLEQRI